MAGPNVKVMGWQTNDVLKDHLQRARAFVFAGEEDFGIIVPEAQACGTAVISYGQGGALETVIDGKTGLFFNEQTVESVTDAVARFESQKWDPMTCRRNAELFSAENFRQRFENFVEHQWARFSPTQSLSEQSTAQPAE
jgi:glycosyltransferase involved in cell wall biosynthesis